MINLDSLEAITKNDSLNCLSSVRQFPKQVVQILDSPNPDYSSEYRGCQNIVLCGMGGSALGGRVVKSLFETQLTVPFEVVTGFKLPYYVNDKTLVILSSYSGNTEETLTSAHLALTKKAKLITLTTGGKLEEFSKNENILCFKIVPDHNDAKQPRLATGYSISAIIKILQTLGYIFVSDIELEEAKLSLNTFQDSFGTSMPIARNEAKLIAQKIFKKIPILISSEHLLGTCHVVKNQLNETAKTFSALFDIPELNHHLMEGLAHPNENKTLLQIIMFNSKNYSLQTQKRYPLTVDVLEKNNVQSVVYKTISNSKLAECFEIITLGSYLQLYLATLYEIDPGPVVWVDYFKKALETNE